MCRRSLSLILIPFLLCILKYYLVRFLSMRSFYDKHSSFLILKESKLSLF